MIVVNLTGGLGNQMFQYAFGRYLSFLTNKKLYLNVNIYNIGISNRNYDLDIFILSEHNLCVSKDLNSTIEKNKSSWYNISERFFHYDSELMNELETEILNHPNIHNSNIILSGYWQSIKYFEKIIPLIKKDFTFKNLLEGKCKYLLEEIKLSESIMINVRRGDFLQKMDYHGVVSAEYVHKAIRYMEEKLVNPKFFLFSDDISWCERKFRNYKNLRIIGEDYYDAKFQSYLQLMSACKHFIISNSTFSWWSVFLSKSDNQIVVAPSSWFSTESVNSNDIYLNNWIKL